MAANIIVYKNNSSISINYKRFKAVFDKLKKKLNEKEYIALEMEVMKIIENVIKYNGIITLTATNDSVLFVIDRKLKKKVKVNYKNISNVAQRYVNFSYGEMQPKEDSSLVQTNTEAMIKSDLQNYGHIDSAIIKTKVAFKLIKAYKLDEAKSVQVKSIGLTNNEDISTYFKRLLIDDFAYQFTNQELNEHKCNIKMNVEYFNGSKKGIYVYIDESPEYNRKFIDISQLFLESDIKNAQYKNQRIRNLFKRFRINSQLFSEVFRKNAEKDQTITLESNIDLLELDNMLKVICGQGYHYVNHTASRFNFEYPIDRSYYNKANNIEKVKNVYRIKKNGIPSVDIQITTSKVLILFRFISEYTSMMKPTLFIVDWRFKDGNSNEQELFT